MATQVENAIAWAKRQAGSSAYSGRCQAFVADCFAKGAGMARLSASSAKAACASWRVSTDWSNVPAGAAVYFYSPSSPQFGHVALCMGGGAIIHAFGKVKTGTIAGLNSSGYTCLGWGWNGGVKPTGAGTGSYGSNSYTTKSMTVSASTASTSEPAVVHIPQTEKIYTKYEADDTGKGVDAYQVVWKAYGGEPIDITGRAGKLKLKDDADSIATELSFDCAGSTLDRYIGRVDIQTGDKVSLVNTTTNECLFLGSVEKVSGIDGESVSVTCYDSGAMLGYNEVLAQFDNCAASKAISHLAGLCGISRISCPNLISSVYETYKAKASSAIQGILKTIQGETGVIYFPRVMGDCLVIKSFASDVITPYYRQEKNLPVLPCMAEMSELSASHNSTGLKTSVQIYSTKDKSVSILASKEDADKVKIYGKRNGIETYSDSETVSAKVKAENTLAEDGKIESKYTCTAFGSDRVVAGCMIEVPFSDAVRKMYVQSVEHSYDSHHTMKLELITAEGVNGK